ncbi:hypothetical protein HK096_002393 [Nowakowskiella sp. JEL0078]|nr:hypothetical protein HK096_002393 [Nowakowskiella sp. JEL0078]
MIDFNLFKDVQFEAIVADEGHRLKNDSSKTFTILGEKVNSRHRVLMTGTPLQNNLRELFNLLHFLEPEHFANQNNWEKKFSTMTEENINIIHSELRPYFLRRTKAVVLKNMPTKVEFLVPVTLTLLQKQLYKAVLAKNISNLRINITNTDVKSHKIVNFQNVLMELRKICNHPYLIPNIENRLLSQEESINQLIQNSGKLMLLRIMLRKLKERGHRVLLFSQFKIALSILEDFLIAEKYSYCRMLNDAKTTKDGETSANERQKMIDNFNSPQSPHFIFLLTTRTGGLGINLVTADTVIIYDADWNPHADLQAMARAHRIGQTKDVAVYKLFTKNCVEERIIEIGKNKLVLDHLVVESMEEGSSLDKDEVASIIRFGATAMFEETDEANFIEKAIKYDNEAVNKLLDDRSIVKPDSEEHQPQSKFGNFSFAKVWMSDQTETEQSPIVETYTENEMVEVEEHQSEKLADSMEVQLEEKDTNQSFWDGLVGKVQHLVDVPMEIAGLIESDSGKRRLRQRATVHYGGTKAFDNTADFEDTDFNPDVESENLSADDDSSVHSLNDASEPFLVSERIKVKKSHTKKIFNTHSVANISTPSNTPQNMTTNIIYKSSNTPTIMGNIPTNTPNLIINAPTNLNSNQQRVPSKNKQKQVSYFSSDFACCWLCLGALHPILMCPIRKNVNDLLLRQASLSVLDRKKDSRKAAMSKGLILDMLLREAGYTPHYPYTLSAPESQFPIPENKMVTFDKFNQIIVEPNVPEIGENSNNSISQSSEITVPATELNQGSNYSKISPDTTKLIINQTCPGSNIMTELKQPLEIGQDSKRIKISTTGTSFTSVLTLNSTSEFNANNQKLINFLSPNSQNVSSSGLYHVETQRSQIKSQTESLLHQQISAIQPGPSNQEAEIYSQISPLKSLTTNSPITKPLTTTSPFPKPMTLNSVNPFLNPTISSPKIAENTILAKKYGLCVLCEGNHVYYNCVLIKDKAVALAAVSEKLKEKRFDSAKADEIINVIQFHSGNNIKRAPSNPATITTITTKPTFLNVQPVQQQFSMSYPPIISTNFAIPTFITSPNTQQPAPNVNPFRRPSNNAINSYWSQKTSDINIHQFQEFQNDQFSSKNQMDIQLPATPQQNPQYVLPTFPFTTAISNSQPGLNPVRII